MKIGSSFWYLFVFVLVRHGFSQRNAEEEAICAPFLTSKETSPMIENLRRNLTIDENAEFSCELVLQDQYLPMNIRVKIHEGLFNLALRHIEQGYTGASAQAERTTLLPREHVAYSHITKLATYIAGSCYVQYLAGFWAMHPMIGRPEEAISFFEQCFIGEARNDTRYLSHQENYYLLLQHLVKAHLHVSHLDRAQEYVEKLLLNFPFDQEMLFLFDQLNATSSGDRSMKNSSILFSSHQNPTNLGQRFYSLVQRVIDTERVSDPTFYLRYQKTGSTPLTITSETSPDGQIRSSSPFRTWKPIRYTTMITQEQFLQHIEDRQPFIVSLGNPQQFDTFFLWQTAQWFTNQKQYLKKKIGSYQIMMESTPLFSQTTPNTSNTNSMFGLSMITKREYVDFAEIVSQDFQSSNRAYYLNIQPDDSGDSPYRPPLHLLQGDLSPPDDTNEDPHNLLKVIWSNLTAINLWMGKIPSTRNSTQSRLHRDATDNLYLLYEGKKVFHLWNPATAFDLQTISPVVGVNEEGLSYLWNTLRFRDFLRYELHQRNQTLRQYFLAQQPVHDGQNEPNQLNSQQQQAFEMLATLLSDNTPYDLENIHFSKCQTGSASSTRCHQLSPPEVTIELSPGDLFYLPTGFFHEVISSEGEHSAINLWWKPLQWQSALNREHELSHQLFQKVLYAFTQ